MNGIIQNMTTFVRADYDNLPKCLLFDCMQCLFSNGDEVFVIEDSDGVCGLPYENGYMLVLEYAPHDCDFSFDYIYVFVQQGSIRPISYVTRDIDDNGYAYIDDIEFDEHLPYIATKLYPSATEDWKDYLVACMMYC